MPAPSRPVAPLAALPTLSKDLVAREAAMNDH